ncbi:glycoside hydrolase superfamily [Pelagophyceae sp. CCMP2097]|nr:glycoside hydrolase superfamily [Pelagophyceae sp. CCMP2097]
MRAFRVRWPVWLVVAWSRALAAPQRSLKIRGVNLGGWLVLEKWIKPSLFADWEALGPAAPQDQWTYCENLGRPECKRRLLEHWDSWVTETTFDSLSAAGITHVRVPIGHWILGDISNDEPYVFGEWPFLARAARWAAQRNMGVYLDLHTAPGSQNGFDNSGRMGKATWDSTQANVNRTLRIVQAVSDRVRADALTAITGFGLLNEPDQHTDYWRMLEYYNEAYTRIRSTLGGNVAIYIGDMFNPQSFNWYWHAGNPVKATNVFLDTHIYACFVDDLKAMTPKQHVRQVCAFERGHINACCWAAQRPTELGRFVGEWTAAYDQTPSPELQRLRPVSRPLDGKRFNFLRQYVLAQMMTYEATPESSKPYMQGAPALDVHGWFFWNFHMEADVYREWDYLRGVDEGWIPRLVTDLTIEEQFGETCESLEKEAADCTDGVVEPFPPLKNWVGMPCHRPSVISRALGSEKRPLALVVALLLLVAAVALFRPPGLTRRLPFFGSPGQVHDDAATPMRPTRAEAMLA